MDTDRLSRRSATILLYEDLAESSVPLITVPITLACVHYHPAPVDPCPCFEDAIAILSVLLGGIIGQWWEVRYDLVPSALSRQIWGQGVVSGVAIVVERLVVGTSCSRVCRSGLSRQVSPFYSAGG